MKMIFLVALLWCVGCSINHSSVCNLNLAAGGWGSVDKNSNEKIKSLHDSGNSRWYKNSNGDYLVCHVFVSDRECGGIYEIFTKKADGVFVVDEIFCME